MSDQRRDIPKPDFLTQAQWDLVLQNSTKDGQKASSARDVEIYVRTQGQGDGFFQAMEMDKHTLILTVTGRKSGRELSNALLFIRDGEDVVVVGSTGGLPEHPQWYKNLQVNPRAWVQIGAERWEVHASTAGPTERARLWPQVVEVFPLWAHFQKYSSRAFPIVLLREAGGAQRPVSDRV